MPWTIDTQDVQTGSTEESNLPFHGAKLNWTIDGPGSCEVNLMEPQVSEAWRAGLARACAKLDGDPLWCGTITQFEQAGTPDALEYTVSGKGLEALLDTRIVRFGFYIEDTTDNIVAALLDEMQEVQINGNLGLSMGSTTGSFPNRKRSYCRGAIIGEAMRELGSLHRGFDMEVDATGAINLFAPERGTDTGNTLTPADTQEWRMVAATDDLLTNVTAIGSEDEPWGPRSKMARIDGITTTYGRHEESISVETVDDDELIDAAFRELKSRLGAATTLQTRWLEEKAPWAFGDVWLNDVVTVDPGNGLFGGDPIDMACTSITITLEQNEIDNVEMEWRARVQDNDLIDGDIDEES